jgi:ribosomal protein RSM22 (predicted rRNA methylase)
LSAIEIRDRPIHRAKPTASVPGPRHLPPDLPFELREALDRLATGISRKELAARAATLSENYRAGGGSQAIQSPDDALAYAFARLPATYAAAVAVFNALRETCDIAPRSLLDVGAGPGTAAFAAAEAFAGLADVDLVDPNAVMRRLGSTLLAQASSAALRAASYHPSLVLPAAPADLVVASYVVGELAPGERASVAQALWEATAQALVVIEPGTPAGYARIIEIRGLLVAAGAHVAAPCPHRHGCPLVAPDWCHFAQRLPRSRDHQFLKGASVPFEDEKFSYVVLSRTPPHGIDARVLAPPKVTKSEVAAKLCTAQGIVTDRAARRDGDAYRVCKSWRWGDGVIR